MDYQDSGISLSPSYRQLNSEFRFEIKRLQTFLLWPVDAPIESARIAKAGFYYTGSGQECQCFACNGKIQLWEYGDQAMARHRQMNPSCPFVLNRSANVPLSSMAEWNENQSNQYPQASPTSLSGIASPVTSSHLTSLTTPSDGRRGSTPEDSQITEGYGSDSGASYSPQMQTSETEGMSPSTRDISEAPNGEQERGNLDTWNPYDAETNSDQDEVQIEPVVWPQASIRSPSSEIRIQNDPEVWPSFEEAGDHVDAPVGHQRVNSLTNEESSSHTRGDSGPQLPTQESPPEAQSNRIVSQSRQWNPRTPGTPGTSHMWPRPGGEAPNQSLSHEEWQILKREDVRLRTFDQNFSATFLNPSTLAAVGFFYLGVADHVQCAFCRGVIADWEVNDDPRTEHLRLFPNCPFGLGLPVGNVPIGQQPARSTLERTGSLPQASGQGFDVTQRFAPQMRTNAVPDTTPVATPSSSTTTSPTSVNRTLIGENLEELGISKHRGPRYPTYATVESRLKSFNQWPTHLKQTPAMMAAAGFFYLGASDHVKCFHCDGGLRNWEPQDDPWLEHARWFPQCRFVGLMKGEQFIKEAAQTSAVNTAPRSRSNPPPIPLNAGSSRTFPREVSEEELRALLDTPVAQTVLNMGVDLSRVKQALKLKIRATGQPFSTVDSLLEAAIEVQHYSDYRQAMEDRNYETVEWLQATAEQTRRILNLESSESSSEEPNSRSEAEVDSEATPEPETSEESPMEEVQEDTELEELVAEPPTVDAVSPDASAPVAEAPAAPSTPKESLADSERTHLLEEEVRRLREARLCKVCLDEEVSIAYIPCGHIVTCVQCAAALEDCPLCRNTIKGTVRIFFS